MFTLHLGVSHVLIDREDKKGRRGNIWCWLQNISILNVRLPLPGEGNCDEASSGVEMLLSRLKKKNTAPHPV